MNSFISNFKNMVLIIVKAGLQEKDCPIDELIVGKLIDTMFDDPSTSSKLLPKFKENINVIEDKMKSKPSSSNRTFKDAIHNKDKSIFRNIDLFPEWIQTSYSNQINWFSNFIENRINPKHMDHIWKYLDKVYNQSLKL